MRQLPTTLVGQLEGNDIYFRLYKRSDNNLMSVVTMQWFDEGDYHENRFVRNEEGEAYYFLEESHAIQQLNIWYKADQIDPEYAISSSGLIR